MASTAFSQRNTTPKYLFSIEIEISAMHCDKSAKWANFSETPN